MIGKRALAARAALVLCTLGLGALAPSLALSGVWIEQNANSPGELFAVDAVSGSVAWAGGISVVRTVDGGGTWEPVPAPANYVSAICALDDMTCVIGDWAGSLYRTADGGAHWDLVATAAGSFINAVCFFDALHGWAVGDPVGGEWVILESSDGGATWAQSPTAPPAGPGHGLWGSASWIGSTIGAFGTNQWVLWRTTDGGLTWTQVTTEVRQVAGLVLDQSGIGLIGGDLDALGRSTDSGATWNLVPSPTLDRLLAFSWVADTSEVWGMTSQRGHFHSSNAGVDWILYPLPFDYMANDIDFAAPDAGWSVGRGANGAGRIWRYGPGASGMAEAGLSPEPIRVTVHPNPFATSAAFRFEGGQPGVIAIFDVSGREVARLASSRASGTIVWDGRDRSGRAVASGVYFYRVASDGAGSEEASGRLVRAR